MGAELPITRGAAASVGKIIVGAAETREALYDVVRGAPGHLDMEVMLFAGPSAREALKERLHGGTLSVLASPLYTDSATFVINNELDTIANPRNLRFHDYRTFAGDPTKWQHSKLLVETEPDGATRSWFTNVVSSMSPPQPDTFVELLGPTNRAAARVAATWRSGSTGDVAEVLRGAKQAGLPYNDAASGTTDVTDSIDTLLRGRGPIKWITKKLDDERVAVALLDAARSGVPVALTVQRLGRAAAEILRAPGDARPVVALAPVDELPSRINLLVSGDTGLLTTAYAARTVLRPDEHGQTAGRESGLLLRGWNLYRLRTAVASTDAWRAITHPELVGRTDGSDALRGYQLLPPTGDLPSNIVERMS